MFGTTFINRIVGNSDGGCSNNYSYNMMIVQNSEGIISITDGDDLAGIGKPMATLKSLDFYTATNNWFRLADGHSVLKTELNSIIWIAAAIKV